MSELSREPGSPKGLYEIVALQLAKETPEKKKGGLLMLREALALKIEDGASTPGTHDAFSEAYHEQVEKLRNGEKIPCGGQYAGYVSAVGQEFSLSEEDKIIFRKFVCKEGDFIRKKM